MYSMRFPVCGKFMGENFNLKAHDFISTCLTGVLKNAIVAVLSLTIASVRAALLFLPLPLCTKFLCPVTVRCYPFNCLLKSLSGFNCMRSSDTLMICIRFSFCSQLVHFMNSNIMTDVLINLNSFLLLQYTG